MKAVSKNPNSTDSSTIARAEAAALLMLTPQRLDQLVREGWIRKPARGEYDLREVCQGYVRFLRNGLDRKGAASEANSGLLKARARLLERDIAKREAELIDIEEHEAITTELVTMVRETFETLPERLPASVPYDIRKAAKAQVDEILSRLERRKAELNAELRATGTVGEGGIEQ